MSCLIPVLVSNTTTTAITTEAQLICYHQCNICGIIFDCDESQKQQKCKLPFYNNKIKCSLCAIRSPLFQRPLKSIPIYKPY